MSIAYETLRDPERRRRYDMFGADRPRGSGAGAAQRRLLRRWASTTSSNPFFSGGGPFGGGGGRQTGQPRRGDDIETVIDLAFEESIFGVDLPGEQSRSSAGSCPMTAKEAALAPGTNPDAMCPECDGNAGQVRRVRQSILGTDGVRLAMSDLSRTRHHYRLTMCGLSRRGSNYWGSATSPSKSQERRQRYDAAGHR